MKTENQTILLRNAAVEPTDEALKDALGTNLFAVYQELLNITTNDFGLEYGWRYYNDGKSWLFKAVHKKKTIYWLSVWDGFIKTSFFFTEKTRAGIFDLPINEEIKEVFSKTEAAGKLIALIIDIYQKEQLDDFRELIKYKKSLK